MNTSNLNPSTKPELGVVLGQPDIYSTSFQTRNLVASLSPWFTPRYWAVPASTSKLTRSAHRLLQNYIKPMLTRPGAEYLLYCNDGIVDLEQWRGKSIIYWYDASEDWSIRAPRRSDWIQRLRYNNILLADYIFAVSAAQVRVARALRPGRQESVMYLPVGVDCRVFDPTRVIPERIRKKYALPRKTIVGYLGYLGAMHGRFAGEILLEAAPEILKNHDAHFLIVGFGPALIQWKTRITQLGLSDKFTLTGYVGDEDVPHCIAAMDVCVDTLEPGFHSEARSETKLKQYMAMGRACVATSIGENCVDLEGGRCGVLVEPGATNLAKGIGQLLDNEMKRDEFGRAALLRALSVYDWRVLAARFAAGCGVGKERA